MIDMLGSDNSLKQPKPSTEKFLGLISNITKGYIKIPKFQREFVWDIEKTSKLLDSIVKGYPIGTFILWKTREELKTIRNIGEQTLPPTPKGDFVQYILDGQQRITSLYVAAKGLCVHNDDRVVDYKEIYVDLVKNSDNDDAIVTVDKPDGPFITVHDLLSQGVKYLHDHFIEHINKIDTYQKRFLTYDFSTIVLEDYDMDVAVEIFTRINTTGTELTLFEIMIAKTYDETEDFDLEQRYSKLQEELEDVGYSIPGATLLQCLSINLVKDCKRKTILKLNKNDIIKIWDDTITSIKESIDYFRRVYRIPVDRLLPYSALIVPFSYFFFNNDDNPDTKQEELLMEYFWRSALSYRFSSGVEGKLGQDARRMDQILAGKRPEYSGFAVQLDQEYIENKWFSTGDSYCRAVLCVYAYFEPKSFNNHSTVILNNAYLQKSNSRNYFDNVRLAN